MGNKYNKAIICLLAVRTDALFVKCKSRLSVLTLARDVLQLLCDIWSAKNLSNATKICVYETLVLSVLIYNSETWCLTATQAQRLKVFEMACLRKIEGVTRRDRIRNEEIYRRVGMNQDILSWIQQRRLRYFGHISRLQDNRYPKIALHGRFHGQRCRGRPKKRWIDTIRRDINKISPAYSKQP